RGRPRQQYGCEDDQVSHRLQLGLCLDRRYLWQAIDAVNFAEPPVLYPVVTLNGQWPPGPQLVVSSHVPLPAVTFDSVSSIGTPATTCSTWGTVTCRAYAYLPLVFLIFPTTGD